MSTSSITMHIFRSINFQILLLLTHFFLLIQQPTRISSRSNTLTDHMFLNVNELDIVLVNLIAAISYHLPQFSIISNIFGNISSNKSNSSETSGVAQAKILGFYCKFSKQAETWKNVSLGYVDHIFAPRHLLHLFVFQI